MIPIGSEIKKNNLDLQLFASILTETWERQSHNHNHKNGLSQRHNAQNTLSFERKKCVYIEYS